MAISRIGGKALKANLERDSNLTFDTDTLVIDYANGRVGVKTANPSTELQITDFLILISTNTIPKFVLRTTIITN